MIVVVGLWQKLNYKQFPKWIIKPARLRNKWKGKNIDRKRLALNEKRCLDNNRANGRKGERSVVFVVVSAKRRSNRFYSWVWAKPCNHYVLLCCVLLCAKLITLWNDVSSWIILKWYRHHTCFGTKAWTLIFKCGVFFPSTMAFGRPYGTNFD